MHQYRSYLYRLLRYTNIPVSSTRTGITTHNITLQVLAALVVIASSLPSNDLDSMETAPCLSVIVLSMATQYCAFAIDVLDKIDEDSAYADDERITLL